MKGKIYFKEVQKFQKTIPAIILIVIALIWLSAIYWQIFLGNPIGTYAVTNLGLILIGIIILIPIILVLFLRMETRVKEDGIFYKLKPIEFGWHKIPKSEIVSYKLIKKENQEQTYTLKLKLKSGKTISITTNDNNKLSAAMAQVFK